MTALLVAAAFLAAVVLGNVYRRVDRHEPDTTEHRGYYSTGTPL